LLAEPWNRGTPEEPHVWSIMLAQVMLVPIGVFALLESGTECWQHERGELLGIEPGEGRRNRAYVSPTAGQVSSAEAAGTINAWSPTTILPEQALGFRVQRYGMISHAGLFSTRQLVALPSFFPPAPAAHGYGICPASFIQHAWKNLPGGVRVTNGPPTAKRPGGH
jgi:hypothetical protein